MTGKKQIFKFLTPLLTSLLLSSCATTGYIAQDFDYPISDIQQAVAENLPEGVGATNSNRRVFYSKMFTQKQEGKARIPLVMRIVVNGEGRPYTLEVGVKRVNPMTKKTDEAYDFGDEFRGENSLAKRVATSIKDQLALRRKNKNMFDDFTPF